MSQMQPKKTESMAESIEPVVKPPVVKPVRQMKVAAKEPAEPAAAQSQLLHNQMISFFLRERTLKRIEGAFVRGWTPDLPGINTMSDDEWTQQMQGLKRKRTKLERVARPMSGYTMFMKDNFAEEKRLHPEEGFVPITKQIAEKWKSDANAREIYREKARVLKLEAAAMLTSATATANVDVAKETVVTGDDVAAAAEPSQNSRPKKRRKKMKKQQKTPLSSSSSSSSPSP